MGWKLFSWHPAILFGFRNRVINTTGASGGFAGAALRTGTLPGSAETAEPRKELRGWKGACTKQARWN